MLKVKHRNGTAQKQNVRYEMVVESTAYNSVSLVYEEKILTKGDSERFLLKKECQK